MRYMGSANRIAWNIGIPVILGLYIFFLAFDKIILYQALHQRIEVNSRHKLDIIDKHKYNIGSASSIDNIILGGSNAVFSLSAEKLMFDTGEKWYNLTLFNEGFSDQGYLEFLEGMRKSVLSYPIKRIIYSPIYQFRVGDIKKRSKYVSADGKRDVPISLNLKPDKSILSQIKDFFFGKKVSAQGNAIKILPLPNMFGDFDFSSYNCGDPRKGIKYEREDVSIATQWIVRNLIQFTRIFEQANITLLLPSEYYGDSYQRDNSIKFRNNLFSEINALLSKQQIKTTISYIEQPPYPSLDLICDGRHHANIEGREWRTANLLKQLTFQEK